MTATTELQGNRLAKHANKHVAPALRLASELLAQAKKYDCDATPRHLELQCAAKLLTILGQMLADERTAALYHRSGAAKEEGIYAKKVAELERKLASMFTPA